MLNEDDKPLSVTLSVNEECPSDTRYHVLVTFGTRHKNGSGDCVGQMNTTVMTILPGGPSMTFSVYANTVNLEDEEVYCYMAIINGTMGEYIHVYTFLKHASDICMNCKVPYASTRQLILCLSVIAYSI